MPQHSSRPLSHPLSGTSASPRAAVTLHELSFAWPDGAAALSAVCGTFPVGRSGLIGRNGSGKSTLLRLVAGDLAPTSGRISAEGEVAYLPQTLTLEQETTVADLLGIAPVLAAIRAVEAGDASTEHFDVIGEDWDIEARTEQALALIGLSAADLERRVATLSGGEAMLVAITGLRLRGAQITLLDEPTNNLDRPARQRVAEMVDSWPGTLIVVSHDLELLEHMEHTVELYDGTLTTFGGPYSAWKEHHEAEQAAAQQAARNAKQALKVEKRQRVETETKLARRARTARKAARDGGVARIVAGNLQRNAQASAAGLRSTMDSKVAAAQAALDAADARVRDEETIHLELPELQLPRGRRLLEIRTEAGDVVVQGPERVALTGPNGSGKTTLLRQLLSGELAAPGRPYGRLRTERVGYLPQRLDNLEESASAMDNVRTVSRDTPPGTIRNRLARLLLRGDAVDRPVSTLSGGERFRVSLAMLLLADPPAELLILDEPTNNLDVASVEQLVEALASYRGALLVVSHDEVFLGRLGIGTRLEPDTHGRLHRQH